MNNRVQEDWNLPALRTKYSAVADKPRDAFVDAFVQMQWRGWPNQRYKIGLTKLIPHIRPFKVTQGRWNRHESTRHLWFPISVLQV